MPQDVWQVQREAMREENLAAMILIAPESIAWTVGTEVPSQRIVRHRHAIVLHPSTGDPEIFVTEVEEGFVRSNADKVEVHTYNEFSDRPMAMAAQSVRDHGASGRVGIEGRYLNHVDYLELSESLKGTAELVQMDDLLAELRSVKTVREANLLADAAVIAEDVAHQALSHWWPGMTEADLGRVISEAFAEHGGDKLTMLSVTAGERTPFLNGGPTRREIRRGEVVRIDVIGTVRGYYCDVARTAVAGGPNAEMQGLWSKLVDCRDMALEMIRPGASSHEIYQRYIEKMDAWGLPTLRFLGHGLGLTLHEEPYLNPYKDIRLTPGMVLAIEPLVLFPDLSLQLEEAVLVTEDGCRMLTGRHDARELWTMEAGERS